MTNSITRQLHVCFSKLMSCSSSPFTHDTSLQDHIMPGHEDDHPVPSGHPSSAPVFKNVYNSLYDPAAAASSSSPSPSSSDTHPPSNSATFTTSTATAAAADSDDELLCSAIASRRLLPPSPPGRSNAIADPAAFAFGVGVAVPTYSPDPYGDFRRSMEEMAAAMGLLGPQQGSTVAARRRRRERLYELLVCYLALNRRHAHKYIVGAFTDFLVGIADDAEEDEEEKEGRNGR